MDGKTSRWVENFNQFSSRSLAKSIIVESTSTLPYTVTCDLSRSGDTHCVRLFGVCWLPVYTRIPGGSLQDMPVMLFGKPKSVYRTETPWFCTLLRRVIKRCAEAAEDLVAKSFAQSLLHCLMYEGMQVVGQTWDFLPVGKRSDQMFELVDFENNTVKTNLSLMRISYANQTR